MESRPRGAPPEDAVGAGRRVALLSAGFLALLLGGNAPAEAPAGADVTAPVSELRVAVTEVVGDTAVVRVSWVPPAHGPRPDRYRAYLARVHIPDAVPLGETTTTGESARFRAPLHPEGMNCCPIVDGRASYTDGPGAGAWGDVYPEGPYRPLLTAGVRTLRGDSAGLLVSRQVDLLLAAGEVEAAGEAASGEGVGGGDPAAPGTGPPAEGEGGEPGAVAEDPGGRVAWLRLVLAALVLLGLGVLLSLLFLRGDARRG